MSCVHHGWGVVRHLPPFGETRCWNCGHRLPTGGIPPRQTREFPVSLWAVELLSRYRARHAEMVPLTITEWDFMMYGVEPIKLMT